MNNKTKTTNMYKISKTIRVPGTGTGKRGRKNRFMDLPIEMLQIGQSVRLKKVPLTTESADSEIAKYKTSVENLAKTKGLTDFNFVISLRKTPKRNEIRMWRVK